jgi:hypothetical protein
MHRELQVPVGRVLNGGLADDPFPLTPTLSLGERENAGSAR